ncbi:MAG: response regulator [Paludibacter sp.]
MNLRNFKIGTQLVIGFGVMFVFVIILGVISYSQSRQIHNQTELIYNHPFKVKSAIGDLNADILNIRMAMRDIMLSTTDKENERQISIQLMEVSSADAHQQFDILKALYLGPKKDVENAEKAYIRWLSADNENLKMLQTGQLTQVKKNILKKGTTGLLREELLARLQVIETFADKKSETLYQSSYKLTEALNRQLIIFVFGVLLIIIVINFIIIRNIRKPINELILTTNKFSKGDLNARSLIDSKNEFGELSNAFNRMVQDIQFSTEQRVKTADIAELMLSEEEPKKFFISLLPALAQITNSQMAAIYLLSDDKKQFEHFHSYGMDNLARQSFAVDNYEGEFGSVLSTGKIQTIERIPKDTRFLFHAVSGKLVPREIISIPVLIGKEIVAIISLASIRSYSAQTELLIHNIHVTLSARVAGVLAYQKLQYLLEKLELQKSELEAQKTELESQSVELREQNRELEIQKNQLHEASQLKTNFLSNMSHELRTPLNSVIALSGVLNRRLVSKVSADEYSYLEIIERNGKHLLALINDILDISRIEAGKEEVEVSGFSTSELVLDLISMIEPQAKLKNIELIQKQGNSNIQITSDISKCRHILQNLIGNAVKFTETGSVEIGVVQKGKQIEISVTDTGIGISNHNIEHIFDEFRQADASTSRRYGGTGLGLAIARKYANLLGGTILVESIQAQGSTFTLTLPLTYSADKRVTEKPITQLDVKPFIPIAPAKTQSGKTILLVDDSEPVIIQMKDFLLESGYQILAANNGTQALEIVSQTLPDAIILDLMMPGVDGFTVLENIRNFELTAKIPVLILTAKHITHEDLKNLKRNNIHQLIQKGDVNRDELLQAVDTMLNPQTEPLKRRITSINPDKKLKVLVVEDNSDNMITVKAIIADDFEVFEAFDGENGFKLAKKISPDLILMDIALPGIDGVETLKKIRQIGKLSHIPVIALTASAMTSDREIILAHGFDGYIAKPIDELEFFTTIKSVLFGE